MAAPTLQSYGPGNVDELLTTTLVNMIPGIRDNVFKSNPVFDFLYNKKKIRKRGGASLSHGVLYQTNSTAKSYQRYDLLDVTPQDGMTRDQWQWKQYNVSVTIDGFLERIANAGESKIEDIVDEKKMQAQEAIELLLEQHLFAAAPGSKDIESLATIITNSGEVGDINGTSSTWWQSQVVSSGSFAAQGRADLTNLVNSISVINPVGMPEMLISDQDTFERYEGTLTPEQRFTNTQAADGGFNNLTFKRIPWMWSPQATADTIYALHSSALEFIVNTDTDFLVKPFIEPWNQDARASKILLGCALTTGNRRKLGIMNSITD